MTFPPKFMYNILMRQVNTMVAERRFQDLVAIISPWHSGLFDWRAPTVGSLADEESKKLAIYRKVVFENVLCKLVLKGEEQADMVQDLCHRLLAIGQSVDRVMLSAAAATTLSESETTWHCLTALLSPSFSADSEEPPWGGVSGGPVSLLCFWVSVRPNNFPNNHCRVSRPEHAKRFSFFFFETYNRGL